MHDWTVSVMQAGAKLHFFKTTNLIATIPIITMNLRGTKTKQHQCKIQCCSNVCILKSIAFYVCQWAISLKADIFMCYFYVLLICAYISISVAKNELRNIDISDIEKNLKKK